MNLKVLLKDVLTELEILKGRVSALEPKEVTILEAPKKKRGRPRKTPEVVPVKRKRGRPRKTDGP